MPTHTIYDHPRYYDVLFGFDRSQEAESYDRIFARSGIARGERILEVACGPARVGRLLARRGHRVTGLDRSRSMLDFAREEAAREGIALETLCADMTSFRSPDVFAAACNPLSSFRLLHDDAAADAHLRSVAAALRPGGIYVLDLALQADANEPALTTEEDWERMHGGVTVRATNDAVYVSDAGVRLRLAWGAEAHLRGYTASAFAERVGSCPELAIAAWHPELGRATGVSEFADAGRARPPRAGRALVVLRRR